MSMGTGGTSGTWFPLGGVIASVWSNNIKGVMVTAEATAGSVENTRLMGSKRVELAMVQNETADSAAKGIEAFKDEKITNIRAIASIHAELLQWVTVPTIKSFADLKGKTICVGPAGSGMEVHSRRVFDANGLSYKDLGNALHLSNTEAVAAFKDRKIEGFNFTGGVPAAHIQDVASMAQISIVSLSGEVATKAVQKTPFFVPNTIPGGTYKGVDSDVQTLSVTAMLVARDDLDSDLVYWLTKILIEKQAELAQGHALNKQITKDAVLKGLTVPLHPGAEMYYKEIGLK